MTEFNRKEYSQLFYILQTNPRHLASLGLLLTKDAQTSKFLDSTIFSIFNAANGSKREEFLLLKFISETIEAVLNGYEKQNAVGSFLNTDFTGQLVSKQLQHLTTAPPTKKYFKDHLWKKAMKKMVSLKYSIDLDPVMLYRMKNPTSTDPVTFESAMKNKSVKKEIEKKRDQMIKALDILLDGLIATAEQLPYTVRYFIYTVDQVLKKIHKDVNQDDIDRVLGNLLFYRIISPVLVAPESLDLVKTLDTQVKLGLIFVSKIMTSLSNFKDLTDDRTAVLNDWAQKNFKNSESILQKYEISKK